MLKLFILLIGTGTVVQSLNTDNHTATYMLFDPDCHQNGKPSPTKAETVTECNEEVIWSFYGKCVSPCILDELGILVEEYSEWGTGLPNIYYINPEEAILETSPSTYGSRYGDKDTFVPAVARGVHKHCKSNFSKKYQTMENVIFNMITNASIPSQGADCKVWEPFMECVTKVINCELK